MAVQCPKCDRQLKNLQGLFGHLRMSHGLAGDELEQVYEREKEAQKDNQEPRAPNRAGMVNELRELKEALLAANLGDSEENRRAVLAPSRRERARTVREREDPVMHRADRLTEAMERHERCQRRRKAVKRLKQDSVGFFGDRGEENRWNDLIEQCKKEEQEAEAEVEEAKEKLREAVIREAKRSARG